MQEPQRSELWAQAKLGEHPASVGGFPDFHNSLGITHFLFSMLRGNMLRLWRFQHNFRLHLDLNLAGGFTHPSITLQQTGQTRH